MLLSLFVWYNRWVVSYGWIKVQWFSHWKWHWSSYLIKAYLNHDPYLVYVVEAFSTLNWKAYYRYMSPFSRMQLVRIDLFLSINFSYTWGGGGNFIVTHECHLGSLWRVHPHVITRHHSLSTINRENRSLVTHEPVKFEPIEVQRLHESYWSISRNL